MLHTGGRIRIAVRVSMGNHSRAIAFIRGSDHGVGFRSDDCDAAFFVVVGGLPDETQRRLSDRNERQLIRKQCIVCFGGGNGES